MKEIIANLVVTAIEANLPFWVERLGFEQTVSVPEGDALGFVILKRGSCELMLQSRASLKNDVPEALSPDPFVTFLYVRVAELAPIRAALADWPKVTPERTTFYGAREIIVRDPSGNVVAFAEHEPPA